MRQIDRYILRQLIGPFLFFLMVFGAIFWLNQALKLIDIVVDRKQSSDVFLLLSVLVLPQILELVIPISGFAAAVYLTNRLHGDLELVVLTAAGRGPLGFARPFLIFGVLGALLMLVVTHLGQPAAQHKMGALYHQIHRATAAQLIAEGEFVTPTKGLTFFFGATEADGRLRDILIVDERSAERQTIHSASEGRIVTEGGDETKPMLLLRNGLVQSYNPQMRQLSRVEFEAISYDLSALYDETVSRQIRLRELSTAALLERAYGPHAEPQGEVLGQIRNNLHGRFVKPLLTLIIPLMGAAALMIGAYQRGSLFARILGVALVLIGLNSLTGVTEAQVILAPAQWWILYLPALLAAGISAAFLFAMRFLWKGLKPQLRKAAEGAV